MLGRRAILIGWPVTAEEAFTQFWKLAPSRGGYKVGKRAARKKFERLDEADYPLVLAATKKYRQYIEATEGLAKDPERFLSNREDREYWREWVPEQVPAKETPVGAVIHHLSDKLSMRK